MVQGPRLTFFACEWPGHSHGFQNNLWSTLFFLYTGFVSCFLRGRYLAFTVTYPHSLVLESRAVGDLSVTPRRYRLGQRLPSLPNRIDPPHLLLSPIHGWLSGVHLVCVTSPEFSKLTPPDPSRLHLLCFFVKRSVVGCRHLRQGPLW